MSDIISKKMQIVIDNYFKQECDVNTSIREAFEKGFRIGVKKMQSAQACGGCKHLRKWENEVEYGYLSPCTVCKRKARDYYER